jgi:hypothetical protein
MRVRECAGKRVDKHTGASVCERARARERAGVGGRKATRTRRGRAMEEHCGAHAAG